MTAQFLVHEDDVEQLLQIRRYLIGYRHTNGWSQWDLSMRINGSRGTVYDLESNDTWQWHLSKLQQWPVPFGLRLRARLTFAQGDTEHFVHAHPEVAPLFALSQDRGAWQKWQRMYLTSALRIARKHLGISCHQLADRVGVTRKAVSNWEATADDVLLSKMMFYARELGGCIELGLDKEDG
jgi:DNA-binding XRE family transcriptional regulator